MNTPLRRVSVFCLALILALMGWATWIQGAKASDYMGDPHNPRVTIGTWCARANFTQRDTSSLVCGNTTAEGICRSAAVPSKLYGMMSSGLVSTD